MLEYEVVLRKYEANFGCPGIFRVLQQLEDEMRFVGIQLLDRLPDPRVFLQHSG